MNSEQRFTILISALSLVFAVMCAFLALFYRITRKWTKTEDTLTHLVDDVKELVIDKDKAHQEILITMREDRAATDKRLRWLEEHLWKSGSKSGPRRS